MMSEEKAAPVLRDGLRRNCKYDGPVFPGGQRDDPLVCQIGELQKKGLKVGETAIDFTLSDIHGNEFTLSEMLKEKPVVMELGSFT